LASLEDDHSTSYAFEKPVTNLHLLQHSSS
jgi:hypothetical protein